MDIIPIIIGSQNTNCYLLVNSSNSSCIIIDPGDEADFISETILTQKLTPIAILLTHGHFDHCLACFELKLNFNIPIIIHELDQKMYLQAPVSAAHWAGIKALKLPRPDHTINPKSQTKLSDLIKDTNLSKSLSGFDLTIIPTPGHTPGSISILSEDNLFTGDTIFTEGVGRTDFSYSSDKNLKKSIKELSKLPKGTKIFPGHEEYNTLLHDSIDSQKNTLYI